jgi:hypothetical protein
MFNCTLLEKGLWHYVHEREAWWRVAVDSKFGNSYGGRCSNEPLGTYGVGLWKNIMRGWESFQVIQDLRWEMTPSLDSATIYGMEIWPLQKPF